MYYGYVKTYYYFHWLNWKHSDWKYHLSKSLVARWRGQRWCRFGSPVDFVVFAHLYNNLP